MLARAQRSLTGIPREGVQARRIPAGAFAPGHVMDDELLSAHVAARRLGITPATLYDWLGQSQHGLLVIRGERVAIDYLQGGAKGQGRIKIAAGEVERLKDLMRVRTRHVATRRAPIRRDSFPGITVPLGRPT